jgi:uncharacterized protein YbjQ (UPF0145 family)
MTFGGRQLTYERELADGREKALRDLEVRADLLRADAVVGVRIDYETMGAGNKVLLIIATGTAVKLERQ